MEDSSEIDGGRQRREKKGNSSRFAALQKIREAKKTGEVHKAEICEAAESLFEEVDEDEYSERVRQLQDDDWIVDDGSGYFEDGRDILDEDEPQTSHKGKSSEFTSKNKNVQSKKSKKNIASYFKKGAEKTGVTSETKETLNDDDATLEHLLGELNTPMVKQPKQASQSKPKMDISTASSISVNPFAKSKSKIVTNKRQPSSPLKVDKTVKLAKLTPLKQETVEDIHDLDDDIEIACDSVDEIEAPMQIKTEAENEVVQHVKPEVIPAILDETDRGFLQVLTNENQSNIGGDWDESNSVSMSTEESCDENVDPETLDRSCVRMYWLDAYEDVHKHPGVVHMFGRVETGGKTHSACLTVNNVERVVYILPRETRYRDKVDTGEELDFKHVHEEVKGILFSMGIQQYRVRMSTKKYAFSDPDVPVEAEYLELRYSASLPALEASLSGETFSRVFGTSWTPMELLVLNANLRGPGWINVSNATPGKSSKSWCQLDLEVASVKYIEAVVNGPPPPALKVMTLSFVAAPNQNNQEQLVGIGILVTNGYKVNEGAPKGLFAEHQALICKPMSAVIPFDFQDVLKKQNLKNVQVASNERALLNLLLLKIQKLDPDVIIGHDLMGYWLDLLSHRISSGNVPNWSRLSRLRRGGPPPKTRSRQSKGAHMEWTAGRLVLDSMAAAKELIRSRSFDLTELALNVLGSNRSEMSVQQIPGMYSSGLTLADLVKWMMNDALLSLRLTFELNALPLFLHITQVAGGVFSRTLMGGRADRNEYLLLHAFHDRDYICPDRIFKHNKKPSQGENNEEEGDSSKKKASFAGGLVLEPKKGLYDTYIVLLDFNSLYPSIIQEYNICFTTVTLPVSSNDEDVMAQVPEASLPAGILPTEIRKLVESRKEVKKLMKNSNLTKEELAQYDIRQLALKLTANSMYGCLGFANCRFHAKALAALITHKGREILMHTKELVENMGLDVVYGDTDSIMINTNHTEYKQVIAIGKQVKSQVNKLYRLLELDIDGVYKRLLLLKKKKYAGVMETHKADGSVVLTRELKGVDNVRRDWSLLAKEAGEAVLDCILGDDPTDVAVQNIHELLMQMADKMRKGNFPLESFHISKTLTKNPSEYSDKKGQAHVSVALRLNQAKSMHFKQGDTVQYVICSDGTNNPATQRAYHPSELSQNEDLKIDLVYYLSQQVHPVVARLLEPIEGTSGVRIAECLGLDSASYVNRVTAVNNEDDNMLMANGPSLDFHNSVPFQFACLNSKCGAMIHIKQAFHAQDSKIEYSLLKCPVPGCSFEPFRAVEYLMNSLHKAARELCSDYYEHWMLCADSGCGLKTRTIPLRLTAEGDPICPTCNNSTLHKQLTEKGIFTQLVFWKNLFDLQESTKDLTDVEKKRLLTLDPLCKEVYDQLYVCISAYVEANAYCQVDLASLFIEFTS